MEAFLTASVLCLRRILFIQVEQPWRQVVVFDGSFNQSMQQFHFGHNQLNLVLTGRGINLVLQPLRKRLGVVILFYLSYRLYATLPQKCMSQETLETWINWVTHNLSVAMASSNDSELSICVVVNGLNKCRNQDSLSTRMGQYSWVMLPFGINCSMRPFKSTFRPSC